MNQPIPRITRSTVSVETIEHKFTGAQIIAALRQAGLIDPLAANVRSCQERAIFQVPGGGDWSSATLDLDDYPVTVTVRTETRS